MRRFTIKFDQQDNIPQSSDAKEMGDEPFALPSSSKWEVADRQEKMGKDDFINRRIITSDNKTIE